MNNNIFPLYTTKLKNLVQNNYNNLSQYIEPNLSCFVKYHITLEHKISMKLSNCKSEKYLSSKKQKISPEDSSLDEESEVSQLLHKLKNLHERQQKTKNLYLTKIQQLKTVLAQQNITTINLEECIRELRKQNQKQMNYIQDLKKDIVNQIYKSNDASPSTMQLIKSCEGLIKPVQITNQRQRNSQKQSTRLLKSMNLRSIDKRSVSKSNSRSKLSLFKSTSTLFGKSSQTLLKKSTSNKDLIKIQSEYFQQDFRKY